MNGRIIIAMVLAFLMLVSCFAASETENAPILRENDEGPAVNAVIQLLKEQGWLTEKHAAGVFDGDVTRAVCAFQGTNALEITGMLDDETLTLLIWGFLPEELNEILPESRAEFVWLPTHGGQKFHTSQTCSGMIEPRMASARNAIALGVSPCKKCAGAYANVDHPAWLEDAA